MVQESGEGGAGATSGADDDGDGDTQCAPLAAAALVDACMQAGCAVDSLIDCLTTAG